MRVRRRVHGAVTRERELLRRQNSPGPTRDVLAGIEALVEEGYADPARLGVTGGSYGGYLTNWIVGHDRRFAAAMTCRSVVDLTSQFLSGDIAGPAFGQLEFGVTPWEDPAFYRDHSPLTYAPLLTHGRLWGLTNSPVIVALDKTDGKTDIDARLSSQPTAQAAQ